MAIEVNQATVVQWGRVVFHLDNVTFCQGFLRARDYYEIDATLEEPHRAIRLTVEEVLRQIAVPDTKTGHYYFDKEAIKYLEEYLGVLVGYLSGPLPVVVLQAEREGRRAMTIQARTQPLVQITDPVFRAGFEEAQEPYYADCGIRTHMGPVEIVYAMLTEVAVERGLSEQQLRVARALSLGY